MLGYSFYGHDNDTYFYYDRTDIKRCPICNNLTDKWNEDISNIIITKTKIDISYSYDGILVVSEKFKKIYDENNIEGLNFIALKNGFYFIRPINVVNFDSERRKTRFINQCKKCGMYESIAGSSPVFLKENETIPAKGFVRTDLEFGSDDEKHPLVLCGLEVGKILKKNKLSGIELDIIK